MMQTRIMGFVLLLAAGCSLTPEYRRPEFMPPGKWKNDALNKASVSTRISTDWWKQFGSAELDRLMVEALNNNLDLSAARERVGQFRALAKIAGAPLLPAVSVTGNYDFIDGSRSRNSNFSNNSNNFNTGSNKSSWQGQWNMSYEVDLWGGIRAGRDSALIN